jgi:hypothetical protein
MDHKTVQGRHARQPATLQSPNPAALHQTALPRAHLDGVHMLRLAHGAGQAEHNLLGGLRLQGRHSRQSRPGGNRRDVSWLAATCATLLLQAVHAGSAATGVSLLTAAAARLLPPAGDVWAAKQPALQ